MREDGIRTALSLRFRTNAEQAGVGLDMKSSSEGCLRGMGEQRVSHRKGG